MTTPNQIIARLEGIAAELHALFPTYRTISLDCRPHGVEIHIHGEAGAVTYAAATEQLRVLGVGVREKHPWPKADGGIGRDYTTLRGMAEGSNVIVTMYPDGLPPSCKKVKFIERIKKTQVVECEGEYVEVERERIECGGEST